MNITKPLLDKITKVEMDLLLIGSYTRFSCALVK